MRDWFRNCTPHTRMRKTLILLPSHSVRVRGLKYGFTILISKVNCRILRGCVDWNTTTPAFRPRNRSYILRGCVDWNIRRYGGRILHGCVDWNIRCYCLNLKIPVSYLTWMCGLKLIGLKKKFSCILCECVDWNIVVYCAFVNIPWICRLKCSLRRLVKIFIVIISWQIKLYML